MNTNACTSNRTFYKNAGAEKRNHPRGSAARFYKNTESERLFIVPARPVQDSPHDAAIASVIKLFRGTVVSLDPGIAEWRAMELFP